VQRVLVLFDCDNTLFLGRDPLAQEAMLDGLNRMTGAHLRASDMDDLDHEAQPARWLARELIRRHDLPPVDLGRWAQYVGELYLQNLYRADMSDWQVPAGTEKALRALAIEGFRFALLTGVPETIVRTRFELLGIGRWFPRDQGAFGCETEERDELIRRALERAGATADEAVAVGDTSRDICSGSRAGLHSVAVAFNGKPPAASAQAQALVRTMPELVHALGRIREQTAAAA
jgi:phosphoglycolate phosphatase